jgi:hypothetical protein
MIGCHGGQLAAAHNGGLRQGIDGIEVAQQA